MVYVKRTGRPGIAAARQDGLGRTGSVVKEGRLMMRVVLVLIISVWTGFVAAGPATAEPVFPPGLRVGLEPPVDALVSKRFPGFEDIDRKVAITILDLPGAAYPDLEAAAFGKNQSGLLDIKRETFPFDNGMGFLITGRTEQNGVRLNKWFLLTTTTVGSRVGNLTTLVSVEVPDSAAAIYTDAVVRKALKTVAFRPPPLDEQLALLPFKLEEMAGFRVMQVMPGSGVILTDGPGNNINDQPYMIVGVGRGGPGAIADRGRFARDLLTSSPIRDLSVQLSEPMRITGAPGYEIRATATSLSGEPLSIVQWVRFGGGGFMRIVAVARTAVWNDQFTRFRAVRDGIDIK